MIIEIPRISPDGSRYCGEESSSILDLEGEKGICPDSGIAYDLMVQIVSGRLIVQGALSASLNMECSRCTDFFSTTIRDSSFLRAYDISEETEKVDITADLREAVLLNLPNFPVCKAECKGLCPMCGKNLNEGSCGCRMPRLNNAWDLLDGLEPKV